MSRDAEVCGLPLGRFISRAPAEYSTQYFKPALSFRTDGYWLVRGQNYDYLDIAPLRSEIDFMGSTLLAFFNVPRVYDPDKPLNGVGSDNTLSAPKGADGMFRWLHEHPSLTTEEPDFTEHDIGGSTENPSYAVRFDALFEPAALQPRRGRARTGRQQVRRIFRCKWRRIGGSPK